MTPSKKTIKKFMPHLTNEQVKKVRGLLDGSLDPEEISQITVSWIDKCYNRPSDIELIMCAVDDVLETHGVEAIFDSSGLNVLASYCNTGDTYAATVLYDYQTSRFKIMSWGDYAEKFCLNDEE